MENAIGKYLELQYARSFSQANLSLYRSERMTFISRLPSILEYKQAHFKRICNQTLVPLHLVQSSHLYRCFYALFISTSCHRICFSLLFFRPPFCSCQAIEIIWFRSFAPPRTSRCRSTMSLQFARLIELYCFGLPTGFQSMLFKVTGRYVSRVLYVMCITSTRCLCYRCVKSIHFPMI